MDNNEADKAKALEVKKAAKKAAVQKHIEALKAKAAIVAKKLADAEEKLKRL